MEVEVPVTRSLRQYFDLEKPAAAATPPTEGQGAIHPRGTAVSLYENTTARLGRSTRDFFRW